jgi:hypothetical protein
MRIPILILGLVIFLSSCTYQYLTVASDDTKTNDDLNFVAETDSIRVTYRFSGIDGYIQIFIHNKLNEGLMVDWRRSAIIFGENPVSYYSPNFRINGTIDTTAYRSGKTFEGTVYRDRAREFIPPLSTIHQRGFSISNGKAFMIDAMKPVDEKIEVGGEKKKIRKVNFSKSNSPVAFRSYLTFVAGNDESRIFTLSNSFYISKLVASNSDLLASGYKLKGNEFYIIH